VRGATNAALATALSSGAMKTPKDLQQRIFRPSVTKACPYAIVEEPVFQEVLPGHEILLTVQHFPLRGCASKLQRIGIARDLGFQGEMEIFRTWDRDGEVCWEQRKKTCPEKWTRSNHTARSFVITSFQAIIVRLNGT
jgi:hypothetical protein